MNANKRHFNATISSSESGNPDLYRELCTPTYLDTFWNTKILNLTTFVFIIFLLFSPLTFSQNEFKLIATIPAKPSLFTTDNLGNVYVVNDAQELIKYSPVGKQLQIFSNKTLGKIFSIDASNPLKLLIFFKDNLRIIYTDNMLNPTREEISLEKSGYYQAMLAAISYNNSTWIYNQQNIELVRLDNNLSPIVSTQNLSQVLGVEMEPSKLLEYNSQLYVNNPKTGILVFDIYGTYLKSLPFLNVESFQVFEDQVLFFVGGKLTSFNMKTLETKDISLPEKEIKALRVEKGKFYISTGKEIKIYSYN